MKKQDYLLAGRDKEIVKSAKELLWKIARSNLVFSKQLEQASRMLEVFDRMPGTSEELHVTIQLTGPKRWFGEHEIWHWWEISLEDDYAASQP